MEGNTELSGNLTPDFEAATVARAQVGDVGISRAVPGEVPIPLAVSTSLLFAIQERGSYLEQILKLAV